MEAAQFIDSLRETIEIMEPIEGFDDCISEKTSYRFGEYWVLTYDFDKIRKKLGKNFTENQTLNYIYKNFNYKNNCFVKFFNKITPNKLSKLYGNDMLYADGFKDALVGVRFGFDDNKNIAVYDYDLCVSTMMEQSEEMDEMDAIEYMEYNTVGAYVGEYTPCFLMTL